MTPSISDTLRSACLNTDEHTRKMQRAFKIVADPTDWRNPIAHRVSATLLDGFLEAADLTRADLEDAVMFMTATALHIDEYVQGDGKSLALVLRARGYRAGPAGP